MADSTKMAGILQLALNLQYIASKPNSRTLQPTSLRVPEYILTFPAFTEPTTSRLPSRQRIYLARPRVLDIMLFTICQSIRERPDSVPRYPESTSKGYVGGQDSIGNGCDE